ncbi:MAG: hypothetical protein WD017_00600, partial [Cucumibacter sp.]
LGATGVLPEGARLAQIHRTFTAILQLMSACLVDPLDLEAWTGGFRDLLLRAAYAPDIDRLKADLEAMRGEVREAFGRFLPGKG